MTEIRVAREAGACYGVERALGMVREAASQAKGPVHTLGPLIHNPQVVADLERSEVTVVEDVDQEPGSTLVIRSHGVVPQVIADAREHGLDVVDATCPYVKKVHAAAARLQRTGYQVLVVGEAGHPEVEGILGHAPGALAVSSVADLDGIELERKVGVVAQTTQSLPRLDEVVCALLARVEEVCVVNTICQATSERQAAAADLAAQADVMIVIGGRNSANTGRLAGICSERCVGTHHIESLEELEGTWFEGAELVGVTAGASTPTSQIDEVVAAIRELCAEG